MDYTQATRHDCSEAVSTLALDLFPALLLFGYSLVGAQMAYVRVQTSGLFGGVFNLINRDDLLEIVHLKVNADG
jgi:hypothetical protein